MSRISKKLRTKIEKRAKNRCEYCLTIMATSTQPFEVEHIFPESLGGETTLSNLALSCRGCNSHKYNHIKGFDEISKKEVALFNPRIDKWTEHFA